MNSTTMIIAALFYLLSFHLCVVYSKLLDDASDNDVNVVRIRLTEEKSKRILLQNDVEMLMGKMESLERKLIGRKVLLSCN